MNNFFFKKKQRIVARGFTLVELMVSLTIFSIVMLISVGTLLVMIDINAKAQAIYSSSTNMAFAVDSMTREIRTGYHYRCYNTIEGSNETQIPPGLQSETDSTDDCNEGNSIIFTRERDGKRLAYRFNINEYRIEQRFEDDDDWIPITSEDVHVEEFTLVVTDTDALSNNDIIQPTVDMYIKGYVNNGLDTNTDFSIQSRVVQRKLDLK